MTQKETVMIIVNHAKELLSHESKANNSLEETYIKENNLKIWPLGGVIHFIELGGDYTTYSFSHRYYDKKLTDLLKLLFKTEDIDQALYCLVHAYHNAAKKFNDECAIYLAIINIPQFAQCFNTEGFNMDIRRWPNVPIFSPFAKAKPQNLNTKKITVNNLVDAILAGQVKKVVCNGIHTGDWIYDAKTGNSRGEWDLMDFANRIFTTESHPGCSDYYSIKREGNEIRVCAYHGEHSESYTVYLLEQPSKNDASSNSKVNEYDTPRKKNSDATGIEQILAGYVGCEEACEMIPGNPSRYTVERACRQGKIKAVRIGRKWLIPKDEIKNIQYAPDRIPMRNRKEIAE